MQSTWSKIPPNKEGYWFCKPSDRRGFIAPNGERNWTIVEIYESTSGYRVRGECCGCIWPDSPLVVNLKDYEWIWVEGQPESNK